MRARGTIGALLLAVVTTAPARTSTERATAGEAVAQEIDRLGRARVVVSLTEPPAGLATLEARIGWIRDTRAAVLARLGAGEFELTAAWDTASGIAGYVSRRGLEALLADPEVRRVDVDVPFYAMTAESVPVIGADQAHNRGVTGAGVVVAVIDSGAQVDHPDIAPALVGEACFCASASGAGCCPGGGTMATGPGSANDDNGHGTNVSGIIVGRGAAAPRGVAPGASLVSIKVLDRQGVVASMTQVVSAMDWIAKSRSDVKIVNLSIGSGELFGGASCDNASSFTQTMASAVSTLRGRGVLVIASAGNNGNPSAIAAPACLSGVVAVGATYDGNVGTVTFGCTDASTNADQVGCFSNASPAVDLLAPGGAITAPGLGGGASTFIGTSQAAPHAAGAAALVMQARGGGPDQVLAALQGTGRPLTDPRNGQAFRRVDAGAASQ